jgi:ATP-binding cassette, subfamily B, multidrug efflux pump
MSPQRTRKPRMDSNKPVHAPMNFAVAGNPLKTLYRYNKPYALYYGLGAFFAASCVLLELVSPLIIRQIVRLFEDGTMTLGALGGYFGALVGVAAAAGIARFFQRKNMIGASRSFEYDLRNAFFWHVQGLSQEFYHRTQTGDIMARAINDLAHVRAILGPALMNTVGMIRVPVALLIMLYLSPRLTLLGLAPVPVISCIVYFFLQYMHRKSKIVQELFAAVTSRAQENLAGARVVRAYGIEHHETRDFRRKSEHYMRENLKLATVMSLIRPFIELMVTITIILVIWRGGSMVIHSWSVTRPSWTPGGGFAWSVQAFSLSDFTSFMMYIVMMIYPLTEFGWVLTMYQRGAVAMTRIIEMMTETPAVQDPVDSAPAVPLRGGIAFRDVSFGYDGSEVFRNITFTVEPGQTVAIVGPTGSGKSTLVSLILREHDPCSGQVLLDGTDVRDIPLRTLRAAVGYVPQDTFLFSDTIRANALFGRADADEAALERAFDIAQLDETLVQLPLKYETLLGERGVNLSGGQKQRLTLARAILRDPVILILDDALSSVDTHTEEEILRRLKVFMESRTSILIAHRVSTIRHADLILVLDNGGIVERGTHDSLVAGGGIYAEMHRRQLLEQELEDE